MIRNETGAVLILSFIVVIALTGIVSAYLFAVSIQMKNAGFGEVDDQAFWLAEAGISKAIWNIMTPVSSGGQGSGWTTAGTEESLDEGTYNMVVSKLTNVSTITSTGTVGDISRTLQVQYTVTASLPEAFNYAAFGNTNSDELKIQDDAAIVGDVYYDGDVEVEEDASVTGGLVYADAVTGDGTYTAAEGDPDPVPTYPAFDATTYDAEISTADSSASADLTVEDSDNYTLSGTVYFKNLTVKDNATITGSGTIVLTKDVVIKDDANIASGITILTKKDITVKNDSIVQSGAIFYAQKDITLQDSASFTGSMIAIKNNKSVIIKGDAVFSGILLADTAKLRDDASITGSVVAGEYEGGKIKDNVTVTYDAGAKPSVAPAGMPEGTASLVQVADTWLES